MVSLKIIILISTDMLNFVARNFNEETSFIFDVTSHINSVNEHSWSIGNTK